MEEEQKFPERFRGSLGRGRIGMRVGDGDRCFQDSVAKGMERVVSKGLVGVRESREPVVAKGRRGNVKGRKPREGLRPIRVWEEIM